MYNLPTLHVEVYTHHRNSCVAHINSGAEGNACTLIRSSSRRQSHTTAVMAFEEDPSMLYSTNDHQCSTHQPYLRSLSGPHIHVPVESLTVVLYSHLYVIAGSLNLMLPC